MTSSNSLITSTAPPVHSRRCTTSKDPGASREEWMNTSRRTTGYELLPPLPFPLPCICRLPTNRRLDRRRRISRSLRPAVSPVAWDCLFRKIFRWSSPGADRKGHDDLAHRRRLRLVRHHRRRHLPLHHRQKIRRQKSPACPSSESTSPKNVLIAFISV